jgi:YVTN family beta-propeller protein
MKTIKTKVLLSGVVLGAALASQGRTCLSPCDLDWSADGAELIITAHTGSKLLWFDTEKHTVAGEIPFEVPLSGTAVSADGKTLYVTGDGSAGKVFRIDAESGKVKQVIPAGHTPNAPVLAPDENTLYVCNRFNNDISFIDLASGKTTDRVPVLREPVAADITPDGKTLFVANHNPDGPADTDYVASKISVIDTHTKTVTEIRLVNGSEGVRGLKMSPDGQYVFATHFMARFLVPTTQLERGWVSTDALSVIRVADQKLLYTVLLDDVDLGFSNPWAIGFSGDGKTLLVTAAGSHELSLIDLPKLTEKIQSATAEVKGAAHLDAHNNLSFLSDIRKRILLPGNGPRAIAVKGTTAYVVHYFSDTMDLVDFQNPQAVCIETVNLNPGMEITQERQGEIFFNDANLCFQKWLSCATCHPDGRTDALNWDLLNDGMGNPKNVRSMLLAHQTPRAMTLGVRADAEAGVRAGLKYIQFSVRPETDALAIDAYLKSLKPEPSPYLINGELSESAARGKKLFETMSCVTCHPAPLFTDLKMYEVGTTKGQDAGKPVDTPTLVEIWRTAPYLHDGRAATMREVITTFDHADILKETKELTGPQVDDLVEYLLSL